MSKAFTAANLAYFEEQAATYDTKPWQRAVTAQITAALRSNLDFIGAEWVKNPPKGENEEERREVKLLDYACGTGMVSRALLPYITTATGIDLSPAMVSNYNDLFRASNMPPGRTAHAITGDLLSDTSVHEYSKPDPDLNLTATFDITAVGLGFHHFHSPSLAVSRLTGTLKPGGVLLIIDFVDDSDFSNVRDAFKGAQHTVKTHGFSEGKMRELFEGAGLGEVGWWIMKEPVVLRFGEEGRAVERRVFLARARKGGA